MNTNSKSKNSLKSKHYKFDFVHNTISMLIDYFQACTISTFINDVAHLLRELLTLKSQY